MPTIPVDDLVARARREVARQQKESERAVRFSGAIALTGEAIERESTCALVTDLADRIEAQAAEIARLREALAGIEQHLSAKTDLGWHSDQALRLSRLSPEVSDGPVL